MQTSECQAEDTAPIHTVKQFVPQVTVSHKKRQNGRAETPHKSELDHAYRRVQSEEYLIDIEANRQQNRVDQIIDHALRSVILALHRLTLALSWQHSWLIWQGTW